MCGPPERPGADSKNRLEAAGKRRQRGVAASARDLIGGEVRLAQQSSRFHQPPIGEVADRRQTDGGGKFVGEIKESLIHV